MKRITTLLSATLACFVTVAGAAPLEIKLPPETAVLRPNALLGYQLARQKCSTCHSADYINFQPPGMSLAKWTGEASKMQHVYGAPISDQDVKIIGAYLAVAYGRAHASDPDVQAASNPPSGQSASTPPAKPDAMTLLKSNSCLACHASTIRWSGPLTMM